MAPHFPFPKAKEIDPENDLIKFLSSDTISDEEFKDRFWGKEFPWRNEPGSLVATTVQTNYYLAVREELKNKFSIEI